MNKFSYLKNLVQEINHSGRSFYDHLYETGLLLYKMGEPEYICDAGLYHSIYDTSYFKANLNVDRDTIKQLIGEKSEYLVYTFCNLGEDRISTLLNSNEIPKDIHTDLLKIEYANLIEQNSPSQNIGNLVQKIQQKLFIFLYQ